MKKTNGERVVEFYTNKAPDSEGRMLSDIHAFDFNEFEYTHDYIQWLFPTNEKSAFNNLAPVLTNEDIELIKNNEVVVNNILVSFKLLLHFYGFKMETSEDGQIKIDFETDYLIKSYNWVTPHNHNFLRITRILKCLTLLGQKEYGEAFLKILNVVFMTHSLIIGHKTMNFWESAILFKN